ncbi:MAG: NosD domain-containing protein [Nitrospirota bacterium]
MKELKFLTRWVIILAALLLSVGVTFAEDLVLPEPAPAPVEATTSLEFNGILEATGTHFALTQSEYLNVTVDSTETITLKLESIPEMVTLHIEASAVATTTTLTLGGFLPQTAYYKYQDDYSNVEAFTTDENGKYTYTQDISSVHLVFIQPRPSTIFLSDSGWSDPSVGTWDSVNRIATLTTNVYETIQINANNLTLDGNGYSVIGSGTGYGVYLYGRTGVTIKNLTAKNFSSGICLNYSYGNMLINNTAEANNNYGIFIGYNSYNNNLSNNTAIANKVYGLYIIYSENNTLSGNTMSANKFNFGVDGYYETHYLQNVDTSNLVDGKPIYYLKGVTGQVFDSSVNVGAIYCVNCDSITIRDIAFTNAGEAILFWNTDNSLIENVSASNNWNGIELWYSDGNTISGATASNNYYGMYLYSSNSNTLSGNTANSNAGGINLIRCSGCNLTNNIANSNQNGIMLDVCNGNNLTGNTANLNRYWGMLISSSSNNIVNSNIASGNEGGIALSYLNNITVSGNQALNNSNNGVYLNSSTGGTFNGNIMSGNRYNFALNVFDESDASYIHNIDTSNLVDGKPIYYLTNVFGQTLDISSNAGTIFCINCDGVIIKDLTLIKNGTGVVLRNTTNSIIENVIASDNAFGGIWLRNASGNTITGNTADRNTYGIILKGSSNNTVANNNKVSYSYCGISLEYSSNNNTLSDNIANNSTYGIYLYESTGNTLAGNIASSNRYAGILLTLSSNNTLTGNTASNSYFWGTGIQISTYSNNNVLTKNTISGNSYYGLIIGSDYNQVYNNNFINNATQARVMSGTGNIFNLDKPTGGNYWSDWNTPDNDSDGFVDYPYVFSGGQDNLPWAIQDGWVKPADITPPVTNIAISGTSGNNGWYMSDVTVTFTSIDNEGGSGVALIEYSFDGVTYNTYTSPIDINTEGVTTVYYRSTDNAGNMEMARQAIINIDKTAPEVVINAPVDGAIYILNETITVDWLAGDSVSGLAEVTGTVPNGASLDTATPGIKTFTVAATDIAGNVTNKTVSYNVVYNKTGFLPPIKQSPLLSVFKSGSTIPAKFQLTDVNGNYISTAVAVFMYQYVSDIFVGEIVEGISTSAATTDSLFRYDPVDNQYIFNWDTSDVLPGLYNIYAVLDDGTMITGQVGIK